MESHWLPNLILHIKPRLEPIFNLIESGKKHDTPVNNFSNSIKRENATQRWNQSTSDRY